MKRSVGRASIIVEVENNDSFWYTDLNQGQRNSIRDRIDSILDNLNDWTISKDFE